MESEAKMEPPIHTEYFLSGGAMILIFMVAGARAVISFCILSAIPEGKGGSNFLSMSVLGLELDDIICNTCYIFVFRGGQV